MVENLPCLAWTDGLWNGRDVAQGRFGEGVEHEADAGDQGAIGFGHHVEVAGAGRDQRAGHRREGPQGGQAGEGGAIGGHPFSGLVVKAHRDACVGLAEVHQDRCGGEPIGERKRETP